MAGYHISPSARQRILKEVAVRAQRHVWDVSFGWYVIRCTLKVACLNLNNRKPLKPIPLGITKSIETILASLTSSAHSSQLCQFPPERSVPSPSETLEIRPFLVLCPSDVITIVNALFPEPRPSSSYAGDNSQRQSLQEAPSSCFDFSQPGRAVTGGGQVVEISSSLSNSGSSVSSETVSQDPSLDRFSQQLDGMSSNTSVESRDTLLDSHRPGLVDSYGRHLRSQVAQLSTYLAHQATAGSLHPCGESWSVIYITADGKHLETIAPGVEDDDGEDLEELFAAFKEIGRDGTKDDLERDYHDLKAAVKHLVEEYDVSEGLPAETKSKTFSNRMTILQNMARQPSITDSLGIDTLVPQLGMQEAQVQSLRDEPRDHGAGTDADRVSEYSQTDLDSAEPGQHFHLLDMLEAAVNDCKASMDYTAAHGYWETLQRLRALSSTPLARDQFTPLLSHFTREPRGTIRRLACDIEDDEAWLVWLQQAYARRDSMVADMMTSILRLRNKMWYATDVRHSAAFEETKNVAVALKYMGETPRSSKTKLSFPFLSRNTTRASPGTLLLKTEAQILSLLSASPEHGGTSKLSDDQSEMTQQWLRQRNIVNFCKGEERIHRFCCEIDRCINRLIGHDITTAPVLWSSDLFSRDKLVLDSGYQQGSLRVTDFGTLAPVGASVSALRHRSSVPRNPDWTNRPLPQAARSEIPPQHSLDSRFGSLGGGGLTTDFNQPLRRFSTENLSSSVHTLDTFWSPFMEQRPASAKPTTRTWPRALFDHGSVASKGLGSVSREKEEFLRDLKQDLTGLFLSELGLSVWGRGSETDVWFSSDVGEEFLHHLNGNPQRVPAQEEVNVSNNAHHGSEHERGTGQATASHADSNIPRASSLEPQAAAQNQPVEGPTNDASISGTSTEPTARTAKAPSFPYDSAFQRLLQQFSINPNPFAKLRALQQIVHLTALSTQQDQKLFHTKHPPELEPSTKASSNPATAFTRASGRAAQAKGLGDVITSCEQRRSQTGRRSRLPSDWRRRADGPSDDQEIVKSLQRLYRDKESRPRTLFRDFQFIAAFVPGQLLDETDSGRAFWTASLAALGLKQDVCRMMVETADKIVAYHTKTRPVPPSQARVEPSVTGPSSVEVSRFSMADAARMLTIPAKEGDPVAQRELAIFYLTHPDLVARTTFPLSKPREIFKSQMMNQRDEDPARSDPATMCVAYHWMELSSQGGDELARQYLRAREELNALP